MTEHPLLIVVLAAGKGVRMRSGAKVLHPRPAARCWRTRWPAPRRPAPPARPGGGAGHGGGAGGGRRMPRGRDLRAGEPGGTADAVLAARPALERHKGDVIVLFADTPLVEAADAARLVEALRAGASIAALGFEPADADGLRPADPRRQADASQPSASTTMRARPSAAVGLCNAGAMAFRVPDLVEPARRASATTTPRANTT